MIHGARELKARLNALKQVFKPIGRAWTDETVRLARGRVKVVTGRTQKSIRRRSSGLRRASVAVGGGARYLEFGTPPHVIEAKGKALRFTSGGSVRFAKRVNHPRTAKQPFLATSAQQAAATVGAEEFIKVWNAAGGRGGGIRTR